MDQVLVLILMFLTGGIGLTVGGLTALLLKKS